MEDMEKFISGLSKKSVKKMAKTFEEDKLALVMDIGGFFNNWLGKMFGIISREKPPVPDLRHMINEYEMFVIRMFDNNTPTTALKDMEFLFKNVQKIAENPISNLLYMKFAVVFGVFADTDIVPNMTKKEVKEVKEGLSVNVKRVIEVINLFIDRWNPDLDRRETQEMIDKMADILNRKYDEKGYSIYS